MKNYYEILGVGTSASQGEIKRVYRKLVQQLHPDINPSPEAQQRIREINEAYDVLGDEDKRRAYDDKLQNPFWHEEIEPQPRHRDPAYRRKHPYTNPQDEDAPTLLMKRSLSAILGLAWVGLIFCCTLLVDYLLPLNRYAEKIEQVSPVIKAYRGRLYHQEDQLTTVTYRKHVILKDETVYFLEDSTLVVFESPMFSVLKRIENSSGSYIIHDLATVYKNFLFVPVLLLVASLIGVVVKNASLDFHFSLGLVILALFVFTLIFLLNG